MGFQNEAGESWDDCWTPNQCEKTYENMGDMSENWIQIRWIPSNATWVDMGTDRICDRKNEGWT